MSCLRGLATPDPWNTSVGNYNMAEFQRSGVLDSKYFIHTYKTTSNKQNKKIIKRNSKRAEKSIFKKISKYFVIWKNVRHLAKFQYFELHFLLANILILIVLVDSSIKKFFYMMSCGITFENFEISRFLRGLKEVFPRKNCIFFFCPKIL